MIESRDTAGPPAITINVRAGCALATDIRVEVGFARPPVANALGCRERLANTLG